MKRDEQRLFVWRLKHWQTRDSPAHFDEVALGRNAAALPRVDLDDLDHGAARRSMQADPFVSTTVDIKFSSDAPL